MSICDERLDCIIDIAKRTGLSLDRIVAEVGRAPQSDFDAFCESPSLRPRYMKSSDSP